MYIFDDIDCLLDEVYYSLEEKARMGLCLSTVVCTDNEFIVEEAINYFKNEGLIVYTGKLSNENIYYINVSLIPNYCLNNQLKDKIFISSKRDVNFNDKLEYEYSIFINELFNKMDFNENKDFYYHSYNKKVIESCLVFLKRININVEMIDNNTILIKNSLSHKLTKN